MNAKSYTFTHAITRLPGESIVHGLRAEDIGTPDLSLFLEHHASYVQKLRSTGAKVRILDACDAFPDATFIEDVALCLPEVAILMRPGAISRQGEVAEIESSLKEYYPAIHTINDTGTIEGGDILVTEKEILVGLSERTNMNGVLNLQHILSQWNYHVRTIEIPKNVLHFKTDCSLLDEETILSTKRLADSGCFKGYRVIHTHEGEEACANSIRFNNLTIMPHGFPKTADILRKHGYQVEYVKNTEAAKLDGGMSCLSLRFSPPDGNQ